MVENRLEETGTAPAGGRPWVRSLVLGVVILLCGVAIGSVVTAVILKGGVTHMQRRPGRLPEQIAQEMQEKYGLTDAQRSQIEGIFKEHAKKFSEIRGEVDAEHEALRRSVETVLTPEQAGQWRDEYERMRRRWHSRPGESSAAEERK